MTPLLLSILDRTAGYHAKMANVAETKSRMYEHQGQSDDAAKQAAQRASHLEAGDAIREAIKLLKAKQRKGSFQPPTFDEVKAFAADQLNGWPKTEIEGWFDHFQSNGWKVSGKAQMTDWRAAARNGWRRWCKDAGQKPTAQPKGDPDGWRKFLVQKKMNYTQYKYAPGFLKSEFSNAELSSPKETHHA